MQTVGSCLLQLVLPQGWNRVRVDWYSKSLGIWWHFQLPCYPCLHRKAKCNNTINIKSIKYAALIINYIVSTTVFCQQQQTTIPPSSPSSSTRLLSKHGSLKGPRSSHKDWPMDAYSTASCSTTLWGSKPNRSPPLTITLPITSHNSQTKMTHFLISSCLCRNICSCDITHASTQVQS